MNLLTPICAYYDMKGGYKVKLGYYSKRIIRSILSIVAIMVVIFTMVYSLVPRENIFFEDGTYAKLSAKPDDKYLYKMRTWQKLGYLDYYTLNDYCSSLYKVKSNEIVACNLAGSKEAKDFEKMYKDQGYTVEYLPISEAPVAHKDVPIVKRMVSWFSSIINIDHPWKIHDENNPDLDRYITVGLTESGGPAIKCSGCTHKYLLYTDTNFPFIHQNFIYFTLGNSYPTYSGFEVLDVILNSQGKDNKRWVTYETGIEGESAIIFGTLRYKPVLDKLDRNKFVDHYADYRTAKTTPSMMGTSFIMGILSLILSYAIGLPVGLAMAKHKDGLVDKLGMVYIIFIIAVPSLAYIYLFRYLGAKIGLPSVFPTLGAGDVRSWILPVISLSLPSISSLMLWTRRYVVDQMNSDYVKFAKAKGLNQSEIFKKHIFKNAIIPIAQGIPSSLAGCITGAIMTEAIYSVGGMGKMLPDGIKQYNNAMIVALSFLFSTISVVSVLLGDVVLIKIDPRIQLQEKEGRS